MAANQNGEVDQGDAVLTGAASGALAGASIPGAGAYGAVAGAVIGGGIALFSANSQNDAARKAAKKRNEALRNRTIMSRMAEQQAQSLRSTGKDLGPSKGNSSTSSSQSAIPTGSTPTSAIGGGINNLGTF